MTEEIRQGLLRRIAARAANVRTALEHTNRPDLPFDRAKLIAYMHLAEALPGPGEALVIKQAVKDAVQILHEALDNNLDDEGEAELGVLRDNLPALVGELSLVTDRDDPQFVDAGPELGGPVADAAALQTDIVALHARIAELAAAIHSVETLLDQHGEKLDGILDDLDAPQVGVSLFGLLSVSGRSTLLQALRLRAQTSGSRVMQRGMEHSRTGLERALGHLRKPFEANREDMREVPGLLESGERAIDAGEDISKGAEALEQKAFPIPVAPSNDPWPPGKVFRDLDEPWCPEMVVIPGGRFVMGSPADEPERRENEGPQREVTVPRFALGIYAVTFAEYDHFCEATGRETPKDKGWGRADRPVINVSWEDASAYCEWLSGETGCEYRLPSEAEWEYACRAGTTTPFWWGEAITPAHANYDGTAAYNGGETGECRTQTVPVRSFQANPFGLYQLLGNVMEWVEDDYHAGYEGAPSDGTSWLGGDDREKVKVLRGGSWNFNPQYLRSADRRRDLPDDSYANVGFRVARTLTS